MPPPPTDAPARIRRSPVPAARTPGFSRKPVSLVASATLILAFLAPDAAAGGPTGPDAGARPEAHLQLVLDGESLTAQDMFDVLDAKSVAVKLSDASRTRMRRIRDGALHELAKGARVYGWNQALGPLKDKRLDNEQQKEFQKRILRSHAAGVGEPLPERVARLVMVLRANQMARGGMAVRPELVDRMNDLVTAGVTPVVPQAGSLGSGDLQPMAAVGMVLTGDRAPARYRGEQGPAAQILARAGLEPSFELQQGEALPIISGSTVVLASYADALHRATKAAGLGEGLLAMFMDATRAEISSLDARTHAERRIPEEEKVAERLRALLRGSQWTTEQGRRRLGEDHPRIQDAVSLRAAPHIYGALRETLAEGRENIEREANASTSNPLVLARGSGRGHEFVMGGNWDGALLGHAADTLNAQIADFGVHSQELSARLLSPKWSYGLPANLAGGTPGLNSGMVQAQTVAAALVPEMQIRAMPAGTLSRPAKDGQEDHNTMAMASVRHLHENLDRLGIVQAVLALMSAQGIDLIEDKMAGLSLGEGVRSLHDTVRAHIEPLHDDRYLTPDLVEMTDLVRGGELMDRAAPPGR
ncbi:HAL/PAL/TAL family ammonia-lyase [Streptomyces sp. OZ13]|uniref:HAL/PAL/TAL family ammonia-lyase n=1 Tax=Streptomyces sp. OZ13 TaxID=3452210 RepID=UPI003F891977